MRGLPPRGVPRLQSNGAAEEGGIQRWAPPRKLHMVSLLVLRPVTSWKSWGGARLAGVEGKRKGLVQLGYQQDQASFDTCKGLPGTSKSC